MNINSPIGTTLRNRYEITELLGSGGFGNTYKAKDLDLPKQPLCVVKHFQPKNLDSAKIPVAQKLFEREAQTLYQLGNENNQIPKLFAHFEEDSQFYLVQELIEGHDLTHEIIVGSRKSEQVVFKLLKDILEVLAKVHQNNVIHRDIKPENLRRRLKDGKIVLIDFGAVKEISAISVNNQGETNLTVAIGTRGYMPAEQQDCRPRFSSDIYALGIICFQALTGLQPLKLPRDFNTGELYCDLFSECSSLHPGFKKVLDTMVRFDYRQRYSNATAALQAIEPLLNIYTASTTVQTQITNLSPPSQTLQTPNSTTAQSQKVITSLRTPATPSVQQSFLERILQALQQLFGVGETKNSPPSVTIPQPTPLTRNWEQPEGHVSLDSSFYVARPPIESDCFETILQPGALIRIKAPRQMGKTSLLTRVLHHAEERGCKTANLNFQAADAESFTSLDKFLQWFCESITDRLKLTNRLADYWQGVRGSKSKCINYFEKYLLSTISSPVVLGLDEVDQVFQHPEVAADFFGLLRVWHEMSKNEEIWKKLRLVIVHSKEVYIPLNINQSPFNVGLPIELPELNDTQVQDLVQRHKLDWSQTEVTQLMAMVGGHPYLVRRSLYEIARQRTSLSQLLQTAPTESGIFSDHLRRHRVNLQDDAKLETALKQVVASPQPVRIETGLAFKLRSMGLIKFQGNDVMPLCDMYRIYFGNRLGVS